MIVWACPFYGFTKINLFKAAEDAVATIYSILFLSTELKEEKNYAQEKINTFFVSAF